MRNLARPHRLAENVNDTRPLLDRTTAWRRLAESSAVRRALLYACLALFFMRVVAQVEVLLVAPNWLPDMAAWYSGLLPYPLLLPAQILLLMGMSVLVRSTQPVRHARVWRTLAIIYFAGMAVRLALCVAVHGAEFYLHGAIPIAFHWVLALFALGYARAARSADQGNAHSPGLLATRVTIRG